MLHGVARLEGNITDGWIVICPLEGKVKVAHALTFFMPSSTFGLGRSIIPGGPSMLNKGVL